MKPQKAKADEHAAVGEAQNRADVLAKTVELAEGVKQ